MKFNEDAESGLYLLKSYGDGWIQINDRRMESGFILSPSILITGELPDNFAALETQHLSALFTQDAEVILIGTGKIQALPKPDIHRALIAHGRGFECMTTASACRTYKVLNAESRSVLALLFPT